MRRQQNPTTLSSGEVSERLLWIENQLAQVRNHWDQTSDECLIDSYIYEISSLHKQYQYYLRQMKQKGQTAFLSRRRLI